MAWERVHTDRLNLEVAGVFNNTDKTMAIAATRIVEPEIRTLNRTRAVQDLISGNCYINDIGRFTAFMERFRNGPMRFDPPGQGEYQQQQCQGTPVEQSGTHYTDKLKADDLQYNGTTQVISYINRLECIAELYGEKAILSLLPRAIKGAAQLWFDSLFATTRLAINNSLEMWITKLTVQFRTNASTVL
jgi:hypothetical protein